MAAMIRVQVSGAALLKHGETKTFSWPSPYGELQGFVIRHGETLRAYENKCRHQPLPLDYGDEDFWYADIERIVCKNHGATFRADTGLCDDGPCAGEFLTRFDLEVEGGDVVVMIP